ncbi:leucine-rich repeat-containing protein 57-like [Physella acuta]|uniref:leucine-rich repeat-containing protein 57-like n=1 Tax=Physella acuta TaxID=109671 RepID=UPI0027DB133C|nr:leucine-rich repeat-containing protein 57-like [Physella acuta]
MEVGCFFIWVRRMMRQFRSFWNIRYFQQFGSFEAFVSLVNTHSLEELQEVTSISVELFALTKLSGHTLEIPLNIGRLTHLVSLQMTGCGLTSIPWSFVYLKHLQNLDLSHNKFQLLPNFIGCLYSLENVNLESNHLIVLPTSLIQLKKLKVLNITNNVNLIGPPYNICMQGLDAIMRNLELRTTRKNLWKNSKAFYDPSDSALSSKGAEIPSLVVLSVNVIIQSEQDFLIVSYVPPGLKSYLQEKIEESRTSLQVAKCGTCLTYFSSALTFEGHVCKVSEVDT